MALGPSGASGEDDRSPDLETSISLAPGSSGVLDRDNPGSTPSKENVKFEVRIYILSSA